MSTAQPALRVSQALRERWARKAPPAPRVQQGPPDVREAADEMLERKRMMKPSTADQIEGKLHELKGQAKVKAGQIVNNPNLEAEAKANNLPANSRPKVGRLRRCLRSSATVGAHSGDHYDTVPRGCTTSKGRIKC